MGDVRWAVGVDPGRAHGAAVILDREAPVAAVSWHKNRKKPAGLEIEAARVDVAGRLQPFPTVTMSYAGPTADRVGTAILDAAEAVIGAPLPAFAVTVEDSWVGRSSREAILSARWAGIVAGFLSCATGTPAAFTLPGQWRAAVLGLPIGVPRDAAKAAAGRLLPGPVRPAVAALVAHLSPADPAHLQEAFWIARYAKIAHLRAHIDIPTAKRT